MREAESSVEFADPLEGVERVTLAQVRAIHEDPRHRVADRPRDGLSHFIVAGELRP